jgi:hypothetical protein
MDPFCKDFEATGAKVHLSWAQVEIPHFIHQVSRSIDDIFRQWYPGSNWKPDVIEWLKRQDILRGPNREYRIEDREDYNPEDYLWYWTRTLGKRRGMLDYGFVTSIRLSFD